MTASPFILLEGVYVKIIDRYVIYELVTPFVFGCAIFVVFFLVTWQILTKLIKLIFEQDASLFAVVKLFLYYLPQCIALSFPLAMLLATLIAFGRLASDSEFIAMQASGIGLFRVMIPVVIMGLGVSLITIISNDQLVPPCNRAAKELMLRLTKKPISERSRNILVQDIENGKVIRVIQAARFDPQKNALYDVTILQNIGSERLVTVAKRARWDGRDWILFDGFTQSIKPEGLLYRLPFQKLARNLGKTPQDITRETTKPEELSIREFAAYIRKLAKEGVDVRPKWVELHQKIALPFAALVFALIGAPLGIKPKRSGPAIGLGLSLVIIFIYYIVLSYTQMLGEQGVIKPALAAWLANLVTAGVGIGLIIKGS